MSSYYEHYSVSEILNHKNRFMVTLSSLEEQIEIPVSKKNFESWLDRTGRLETPMQYHDDEGNVETAYSKMTLKEYYDQKEVFEEDIKTYVFLHQSKDLANKIKSAIADICNEYEN